MASRHQLEQASGMGRYIGVLRLNFETFEATDFGHPKVVSNLPIAKR